MRGSRQARLGALGLVLTPILSGCGDGFFFGPEASADPATVFELVWREVDLHYAYFAEKAVDWDRIHEEYRARVNPGTTEADLFALTTEMLEELRDGHVSLHSPRLGFWAWDGWWRGKPANYRESVVDAYLRDGRRAMPGGHLTWGWIAQDVGYIHIRDFRGSGWSGDIDAVLADLAGARALVVDVRDNVGGSDLLSDPIAGRFADRKRLVARVYYRDGLGHDDFHEGIDRYVEPQGKRRHTGPIALLTNRRVFSTGESFVISMTALPHVVVVGDTTGGGAGNPLHRELPNGWTLRVPRWKVVTAAGLSYEGVGLAPDVAISISAEDESLGRDTILERALEELGATAGRQPAP